MATQLGFTQTDRALKIDSPLGPDKLLLRGIAGREAISQPFRFELDLLSEDDSIQFDSIVGKNVTLHLEIADSERAWNGFISRFSQGARDDRFTAYRAEMVPWLWFLTRTADCRIFQNLAAPDIIQRIFKDLGFQDYKLQLYSSYRQRDYCVQYRETDFNFVSRLMEEEGIYYYFQHEKGKHTMVLADDMAAHQPLPGQPKARCEQVVGGWHPDDVITELRVEQDYRPSAWAHTDYNFETPSTSLMVTLEDSRDQIYDYPGIYPKRNDGDKLAKMRLQETVAFRKRATGESTCRRFNTGYLVEFTDYYRKDINQKWLLTAVHHQAKLEGSYQTGSGQDQMHYSNTFECIPSTVPFRAPRFSMKPHVQGCQTAVVVGPGGEEIYTDKYGRVKVQFFWDREGKRNENSSCWMRVSYPWAGKAWGGIHIPRIGQEVIVDFLEGDPDRPIIVGRVYNAEETVPWALPGKAVISGFKSDSTKGGGGYNEFSMDDTKGNELINVHAQYDQQKKVEHDERVNVGNNRTESVGNDESITIGHDRTEKVGNNETITIGVNRTEKVGSNENITIGSNRTESVGSNETITIGSNRTENVGSNETVTVAITRTHNVGVNDALNVGAANEVSVGGLQAITVGATRAVTVGASQSINVGSSQTTNVASDNSLTVGGNQSINVSGNEDEQVGGNQTVQVSGDLSTTVSGKESRSVSGDRSVSISGNDALDVGSKLKITAGSEIHLETGQSKIVMKSSGEIEISGMSIKVTGSTSIKEEAVQINIEASGINTIKGSLVKIN